MANAKFWGQSLHINLGNCNPEKFSKKHLEEFCIELCKVLKMQRYKNTMVERFGSGKLLGNSALQFIETSSLGIHTDDFYNRVFIDIFSCKKYDNASARKFCKDFFEAGKISSQCLYRN